MLDNPSLVLGKIPRALFLFIRMLDETMSFLSLRSFAPGLRQAMTLTKTGSRANWDSVISYSAGLAGFLIPFLWASLRSARGATSSGRFSAIKFKPLV
jgi:hypothetical protein